MTKIYLFLADGFETVESCLSVFAPMVKTMTVKKDAMHRAAGTGFINATDLADYMVSKGMPFRTAYKIVGGIVSDCIRDGKILETMTLDEYRAYSEIFDEGLYDAISLKNCVSRRTSAGGTGDASVARQIAFVKEYIAQ